MHDPEQDDIDRLFAEMPPPAPRRDFGGRARARLRAIQSARRLTAIALLDLGAMLALAGTAFLLGTALARSELPALLRLILEDHQLAIEARRDLTLALVQAAPWPSVLIATVNVLAVTLLTSGLLRATGGILPAEAAR
jgi:hypothetical protein